MGGYDVTYKRSQSSRMQMYLEAKGLRSEWIWKREDFEVNRFGSEQILKRKDFEVNGFRSEQIWK